MKHSISYSESRALFRAINNGLSAALSNTLQPEPQLVANMVYNIPREINALLIPHIKCGGVFVHGQPFVKCDDFPKDAPESVEIGDLLLLRTERDGDILTSRRALLLQAKKYSSLPVTPDNGNQHHIYAKWPTFEYVRSTKALNGKKRHVTGLDLHSASKYLLINCNSSYCFQHHKFVKCRICPHLFCGALTAHPTFPALSHYTCFASELHEFFLDNAGKCYESPPPSRTRNWDKVVHDLTEITRYRVSKLMGLASGVSSAARGQGLFFLSGGELGRTTNLNFGSKFNYEVESGVLPEIADRYYANKDTEGAISIIEFEVSVNKDKSEINGD